MPSRDPGKTVFRTLNAGPLRAFRRMTHAENREPNRRQHSVALGLRTAPAQPVSTIRLQQRSLRLSSPSRGLASYAHVHQRVRDQDSTKRPLRQRCSNSLTKREEICGSTAQSIGTRMILSCCSITSQRVSDFSEITCQRAIRTARLMTAR